MGPMIVHCTIRTVNQNDQKHLRDYVPKRFAPDAQALRFHVTGVVVDCQKAG